MVQGRNFKSIELKIIKYYITMDFFNHILIIHTQINKKDYNYLKFSKKTLVLYFGCKYLATF